MATNIKQIIYFHHRLDATAAAVRNRRSDIDMFRRDFGAPAADNWEDMSRAHGYHACARTEMREPWFPDGRLIAKAPNLLAICSLGAGYDVIDVNACTSAGILVCNQSGANKEAVAEHTVGLMLALSKKIMATDRAVRKESSIERFRYIGTELFGMTVLAYDPYVSKEKMTARNAQKVELAEILRGADYVTMHCPRTAETLDM